MSTPSTSGLSISRPLSTSTSIEVPVLDQKVEKEDLGRGSEGGMTVETHEDRVTVRPFGRTKITETQRVTSSLFRDLSRHDTDRAPS